LVTEKFNTGYCGDAEEGHSIGFQFGGDGKRSNLQLESNNVNHGIKYAIELLIRALIRAGYTVSFIDGILLKQQQIPPNFHGNRWKKVTIPMGAYTDNETVRNVPPCKNSGKRY
jgi:hypothetical protein